MQMLALFKARHLISPRWLEEMWCLSFLCLSPQWGSIAVDMQAPDAYDAALGRIGLRRPIDATQTAKTTSDNMPLARE